MLAQAVLNGTAMFSLRLRLPSPGPKDLGYGAGWFLAISSIVGCAPILALAQLLGIGERPKGSLIEQFNWLSVSALFATAMSVVVFSP